MNNIRRILLVEPNKSYQKIFSAAFSKKDIHLVFCNTGQEAIDYVKKYYVDFICASYYLEDFTGIELCKKIRQVINNNFKPFFLITSQEPQAIIDEALPQGVTDIFKKDELLELFAFINRFPNQQLNINCKVLYVEDSKSQREVIVSLLQAHKIHVDAFDNAQEAWEKFLDNQYDIVITDIVLAGSLSGVQLINKIRRLIDERGDVPIIAVTSYDDNTRRLELFHFGVSDYIVKPIIEQELIYRINSLVHRLQLLKINQQKKLASMVYDNSCEAMFVTDNSNQIIATNPAFTEITGYTQNDIFGKTPSILASGKHNNDFFKDMWQCLNNVGSWSGELWNKKKNGTEFMAKLNIDTIYSDNNEVLHRVAIFTDITDKIKADALILQQANFDPLTKLPNRRLFQDYLQREVVRTKRQHTSLALLFLDLDHFKDVNDTHGHDVGDLLLIEVALRLEKLIRETDYVSRIGGDEFTIILSNINDSHYIDNIAQKIVEALQQPFTILNHSLYISVSIGITVCPNDSQNIQALLKHADQAMYKAKKMGRNCFCYYTPSMQQEAQSRMQLINDLRLALTANQFEIYYQPILNCHTNKIEKAEALLRWHHPVLGLISPDYFIPLAEESGLIIEIGNWVFEQSALQAKKWYNINNKIQISINKSPIQFHTITEHKRWLAYLEEIQLNENHIIIEMTEGVLIDKKKKIIEQIEQYRQAGIEISIDDFGTGYSSLAYLQQFNIDYLKIDRSFVANIGNKKNDLILSEAIIVMAHKLGIKVIAEGVENEFQFNKLCEADSDYVQGYYVSKALPANQFERLLSKQ